MNSHFKESASFSVGLLLVIKNNVGTKDFGGILAQRVKTPPMIPIAHMVLVRVLAVLLPTVNGLSSWASAPTHMGYAEKAPGSCFRPGPSLIIFSIWRVNQ